MEGLKCIVCGKPLTGKQRQFCSVECRKNYYNEQRIQKKPQKLCVICGKPLASNQRKVCSVECLKQHNAKYNSAYIAKRRAEDKEFAEKTNEWSRKSSIKQHAKRAWNKSLEHAEIIMRLAELKNAQILIAKYLDENFQGRVSRHRTTIANEEEQKAQEILDSIRDFSSS